MTTLYLLPANLNVCDLCFFSVSGYKTNYKLVYPVVFKTYIIGMFIVRKCNVSSQLVKTITFARIINQRSMTPYIKARKEKKCHNNIITKKQNISNTKRKIKESPKFHI